MTQNDVLPEGVIHLPDDARDQTINVITLGSGLVVNITRDTSARGVDFEMYVQQQMDTLEKKCQRYEFICNNSMLILFSPGQWR